MEAEVAALRGELQAERSRSRNSDRDRDELREYLARQKDANAELTDEYNAAVVTADAEERAHGTVVRELQRKLQEATDFGRGERPFTAERSCVRQKRVYWPNADSGGTRTDPYRSPKAP